MTASGAPVDVLALFPSFDSPVFGGIQASGREAWRSITANPAISADAFYYESRTGRLAAAFEALSRRVTVNTILVWHCGLLRLVPLIAARRKRLVVFLHGIEAWKEQDYLTTLLMRQTDLFLTNSDHTWQRFITANPRCAGVQHKTVHLGAGERTEYTTGPEHDIPAALMIGRLSKTENYKGHREMIQMWPLVLERMPRAELWIVGDGDLRPELERITAALHLSAQVRFFGAIPEEQKDKLLIECRALILPSTAEGFGLVYLEAMRVGRPCLVSTMDAGTEVVNPPEAGLAVDLGNIAGTVESVVRLLTPGAEWENVSTRARQRYESRFTAAHFEKRLNAALFGG